MSKRKFDSVENTSSGPNPKVVKKPIAIRRNIEEVEDDERARYCTAISRMQLNYADDPSNDWWNICSIHGGGFRKGVEQSFAPAFKLYVGEYGAAGFENDFNEDDWQTAGFCAHGIPTFLIWHRVYMQAFELALQKYDPTPEKGLLAAHYWQWDKPSLTLSKVFTAETITDSYGQEIDNPLLLGPTGVRSLKHPPYTVRGNFDGVPLSNLDHGYRAFHSVKEYSRVCTTNGNPFNFEDPHNQLHNHVGGDMSNVQVSSFDPIFWVHHSNVERMHYAWLEKHFAEFHQYPDKIYDVTKPEQTNLIGLHLYPFLSKDKLEYDRLPWKVDNAKTASWSTPQEWINNKLLNYSYDNITDVCVPSASGISVILTLDEGYSEKTTALVKKYIYLNKVKISGTGNLNVLLRITNASGQITEAFLVPKAIFSAHPASCPNCAKKLVTYVFVVHVSEAVLGQATALKIDGGDRARIVLTQISPESTSRSKAIPPPKVEAASILFAQQNDQGEIVKVVELGPSDYESIEMLDEEKVVTFARNLKSKK